MKLLCSFFCLHLAMSWGFTVFGVPVTVIGEESLEDTLTIEDADKQADIEHTNALLYTPLAEDEEWSNNGFFTPPK